jgi:H/ACA ribonucleoprotein complex subunit 4
MANADSSSVLKKGIVLVDKPSGMTSFDVVFKACRILGASKGGHTGTLDPNVTGLMLIALEEARKAMPILFGMDKEYVGRMLLHSDVDKKTLEAAFKKFTGEITQKPPVKSRVARVERKRTVHSLKILKIDGREVEFEVLCEAGTYIRKLVHDIGQSIASGAHMTWLRRTKIGPFSIAEATPLSELSEKNVFPVEDALARIGLKKVFVKDDAIAKIRNGSPVFADFIIKRENAGMDEPVGIFDKAGSIIALGKNAADKIKTERVFLL